MCVESFLHFVGVAFMVELQQTLQDFPSPCAPAPLRGSRG